MGNAHIRLGWKVSGNVAYPTVIRSPLSMGYRAQSKGIHVNHFPELDFCVEGALGDTY